MWVLVRGAGLVLAGGLLWWRGSTMLVAGLLMGGLLLLAGLFALEQHADGRGAIRQFLITLAGLLYDLALVSGLLMLLDGVGHSGTVPGQGERLPLELLYLLPGAYAAWRMGSAGGVVSAVATPAAFWLTHGLATRALLFDSPADWGWLGGLTAYGFLLAWVATRLPEPPDTALMQQVVDALEESETAHRELRVRYRELTHHYRQLQDSLMAAQDTLELWTAIRPLASPQQVYRAMLERLQARLQVAGAALWLMEENRMQIVSATGVLTRWERSLSGAGARPAWQRRIAEETVQYLQSLAAKGDETLAHAHRLGIPSDPRVLTVPLRTGERYYGVLVLVADARRGFDPSVEARAHALAPHLTTIVSLCEQMNLMETRLQETQVLHDLDKLLFTATTPMEIPQRALALLQPVLRFEAALLAWRASALHFAPHSGSPAGSPEAEASLTASPESEFHIIARWREMPDLLPALQFERGRGLQGWRAARARPLLISDTRTDPHATPELAQSGIQSLMLIGLSTGTRLNGFLMLGHSQPGFFTPADLETAQVMATHLTLLMERARLLHQLERLAVTDGLTGLYNYRHFHERYQEEVRRARRYQIPFAVMLVDLDNFKQVNDEYGHLEGDAVLVQVAELIRRTVRETEIIARYGGDEFALLLPATNLQGARHTAERLLQTVRNHRFTTTEGEPVPTLTLSIGLAAYSDSSDSPVEILEKADEALETAKKTGRNRIVSGVHFDGTQ